MDIEEKPRSLQDEAIAVLKTNNRGNYTVPANGLYPHQWLWDSCFIAIGQRHYDLERAKIELLHLLSGQWSNGMLPNMILSSTSRRNRDGNIWRSWLNPNAPDGINTSGITQPPVLAEAVVRVGEKMKKAERRTWYHMMYPHILAYHEWLYNDRDPHGEGLVLQIHPWETGLDSTPPWMQELHEHQKPFWVVVLEKLHIIELAKFFRRDTRHVPVGQRLSTVEALCLYSVQRRLRRKNYDIKRILAHSLFAVEDVSYNAIFIRANTLLKIIAKEIREELPDQLLLQISKTEKAFEQLWDPYSSQYYSREFVTHRLLKQPTVGTLMPLYAGSVTHERAKQLVKLLEDSKQFGSAFPIPSVPVNNEWFKPMTYWQGPTWVNMNWLIIDGLERYGFHDHAEALRESTLELVAKHGFYEYFSPLDGSPAGIDNFSWTAALTIDLLNTKN